MYKKAFSQLMLCLGTAAAIICSTARAEDVDIFNQPPGVPAAAPNILFILDNSANWSKASQMWVGSPTQGEAELKSIKRVVTNLAFPANIGLMMFSINTGGPTTRYDGGYMRYGMRNMVPAGNGNSDALKTILNGLSVTSPDEQVNQDSGSYTNALYETWLYLNGSNSWASMDNYGDYAGNNNPQHRQESSALSPAAIGGTTGLYAYKSAANKAQYNSPISGTGCGKTYVIFIGNNRQGNLPPLPAATDPSLSVLSTYGFSTAPDVASAWARFLYVRPDITDPVARVSGSVTTFAIDAYNAQQNTTFTANMRNMAKEGRGQYYQAGSDVELDNAFDDIFQRIQAVNSGFTAISLPLSVSVRGSFDNQVYLGVFRPNATRNPSPEAAIPGDGLPQPQWVGNLKEYKLGTDALGNPRLIDAAGAPVNNASTSFVAPGARSFWTVASTFWNNLFYPDSQGVGLTSDSPDGDLVEKGGAAQYLRTQFATSQTARNVYTCTSGCIAGAPGSGSLLSATPFNNTTATTTLLEASAAEQDAIINWIRGGNTAGIGATTTPDDNPSGNSAHTRGFVHGDVLHSQAAAINYGSTTGVVVFYGANDGLFHAVQGGFGATGGNELWSFVAPEHFSKLKRLREHTPGISFFDDPVRTSFKPYFMDGSPATYVYTPTLGQPPTKAYIYLTTRRGSGKVGATAVNMIYALDVTNPATPRFMWKRLSTETGLSEMGQTWSTPQVAQLRGRANPVLIMGMGYDAVANDRNVQSTPTVGRGVMVLDAVTGALIWRAGPASTSPDLAVTGMDYDIPADVSVFDSDLDGIADRVYAADTGANLWRLNIDDATPANWTVDKLAALGGGARKFLQQPDVVRANPNVPYDAILIGSGDRELPFKLDTADRFYMIKDPYGINGHPPAAITEGTAGSNTGVAGKLLDVGSNLIQTGTASEKTAAAAALGTAAGWYIILGAGASNGTGAAGEKAVGTATTAGGTTFFGTNSPATASSGTCVSNLGVARMYAMNYTDGSATIDNNLNGTITTADRGQDRPGGGLPPPPVAGNVRNDDGSITTFVCFGTTCTRPPGSPGGRRFQHYWRKSKE